MAVGDLSSDISKLIQNTKLQDIGWFLNVNSNSFTLRRARFTELSLTAIFFYSMYHAKIECLLGGKRGLVFCTVRVINITM